MKKINVLFSVFVFVVFVLLSVIFCRLSYAQDDYLLPEGFELRADYAFFSQYVWRGFTCDKDPVLQSGLYLGFKGLTVSIWNSMDIRNREGINSDEVDYVLDYAYSLGKLSLSVGHAYYDYPGMNGYTKEFSVGMAYDCLLSPSLSWKHDYLDEEDGGGNGDYISLTLAKSFPLSKGVNLDISGHVGYNNEYFIEGTGGDAALTLGFGLPLTKSLTFSPQISYSLPYGDLADEEDGNQESRLFGGVLMGYSL